MTTARTADHDRYPFPGWPDSCQDCPEMRGSGIAHPNDNQDHDTRHGAANGGPIVAGCDACNSPEAIRARSAER